MIQKKYLIVKQKGLLLSFDGFQIRTPAKIDITKISDTHLNHILRSHGIEDYTIEHKTKKPNPPEEQPIKWKIPKIQISEDDAMSSILQRFDKVESLLVKVLEHAPKEVITSIVREVDPSPSKFVKVKKRFEEDDEDSFIPSINTSRLKMSDSQLRSDTIESSSVTEAAANLKKMRSKE